MDNLYVANILTELLSEFNRVSLPCLGSFVGQYKPSFFSDDGTTIFPPSKQIDFLQNEIWNDERLEKAIAERENISLGEAKEKLAFWIDNICVELSTGETVILPHFGEFVVSFGNRLKFIEYHELNLLSESFGFIPLPTETTGDITPPTPTQTPKYENVNEKAQPSKVNIIRNKEEQTTPKNYKWLWITLSALFSVLLIIAALLYFGIIKLPENFTEKHGWIKIIIKNDTNHDRLLFTNDFEEDTTFIPPIDAEPESDEIPLILTDSIPETDTAKLILVDSTEVVSDTLTKQSNELYYIIVKSAKTYDDARKIAKDWAKKDFIVQILHIPDDSLPYKLSVGYFKHEEDAYEKLANYKLDNNDFNEALILTYSNE